MADVVIAIVAPIFGVVICGYIAGRVRLLDKAAIRGISIYVFNLAIPLLLFYAMAKIDLPEVLPWSYLLGYYGCALGFFALAFTLSGRVFGYRPREAGIFAFGSSYGSFIPLGIPLVLTIFGERATLPLFMLVATQALVMFPVMTLVQVSGAAHRDQDSRLWSFTRGVIANQYLAGIALGTLVNLMDVSLPVVLVGVLELFAQSATPCALFALGAALSQYRVAGSLGASVAICVMKTVVFPAGVWLVLRFVLELDPLWLSVAVVLAALPVGINTYLFAERYSTAVPLAAASTVVSTAVSMITISLVLLLLGVSG
jgi:predicted permease